ncbi:cell division cycle protein 20 homolog [Liolophura sinensis]|uniref:cell division cycle protein 20 homolog n=1 Tax=Liolophura sinensis TaxID=3198878 RepID=UPI0031581A36
MASHFNFEKMLNDVTKLDAPLQRGPMMRWQRKAQEKGLLTVPLDTGRASSYSPRKPRSAGLSARTPGKTPNTPHSGSEITPKTPSKTPGKSLPLKTSKTPSKKTSKTPSKKLSRTPSVGQKAEDRFIPNRTSTDVELGYYAMMNQDNDTSYQTSNEFQQQLSGALGKGCNPLDSKILSFNQKVQVHQGHASNLRVLYSTSKCTAPKATNARFVPKQPERILDAPDFMDDYYLNLIDWSSNDHLAVALGEEVFLWNMRDSTTVKLMETEHANQTVTSVSWIKEGNILAVGTSDAVVELWDVEERKLVRSMGGHAARIGSLSWNSHILSSGCRTGAIHHHDVRIADHQVANLVSHTQEICGLKWSPDGRYLASGGNDNLVSIWEPNLGQNVTPLHRFTEHQAAVKALAWCPWQPNILATGGGTADRHIRFWNVFSGAALNSVDTNSQVCALLWSEEHREIISGHGYSKNQLILWKYPSMKKVTELTGHTSRILCLAMSADNTMVTSAAADETLRLWKCFAVEKTKKTSSKKAVGQASSLSMMHRGIR